uniref:TSA: Wollemia nobilis Ref_Wollemi_Transcript_18557_1134 transcribed RNA sequence n=1 Tax=Wollemia nobilis TaxID=56998 RepID=A0A0C9RRU0_9CONI
MERAGAIISYIFGREGEAEEAAKIKEIYFYPIKACRGVSVPQAWISPTGFKWDRQWLIVNSKGRMCTQRVEPKLALVEIFLPMEAVSEDWEPTTDIFMTVKAPGMDPLQVPLLQNTCQRIDNVSIWEWSGSALDEGDNAANWFSSYLGKPSRLVRFDTVSEVRPTDKDYARGYKTGFADGYPFLMISQGSLDALNKNLKEPLPINRFRPNIFLEGCEPFAEDLWKTLRINGLTFHGVKLCARCKVPTVNQETGVAGDEPTETLKKFRTGEILSLGSKGRGKVFFGQNLICEESLNPKAHLGKVIKVGDIVHVVKKIGSTAEAAA